MGLKVHLQLRPLHKILRCGLTSNNIGTLIQRIQRNTDCCKESHKNNRFGFVSRKDMTSKSSERNVRGSANRQTEGASLRDFLQKRIAKLLQSLKIGESFLALPPDEWNENADYQHGKERTRTLRVINHAAEHGTKLFEEFNSLLTHDDEDKTGSSPSC